MTFEEFFEEVETIKGALDEINVLMDFVVEDRLDNLNNLIGFAVKQLETKYEDNEGTLEEYIYQCGHNQDKLRNIFEELIDNHSYSATDIY